MWPFGPLVFGSIARSNFLCVHCTQVSDSGPSGFLLVDNEMGGEITSHHIVCRI